MFIETRLKRSRTLLFLTAGALVATLSLAPSSNAQAAKCVGVNKHVWVSYPDPNTGVGVEDVYVSSCKVKSLQNGFEQVKNAASLAALLGAKFWPVSSVAGVMYGWAWHNQSQLSGCGKKKKGVRVRLWAGLVVGCYGQ